FCGSWRRLSSLAWFAGCTPDIANEWSGAAMRSPSIAQQACQILPVAWPSLRRSYMDTLNFALDLDSSSVEALRDFCAAVLSQNKHLPFARLKTPAQQVLTPAALPGLPTAALCALSVDDAVKIAQE